MGGLAQSLPWRRSISPAVERRQFFFISLLVGFGAVAAFAAAFAVDESLLRSRSGVVAVGLGSAAVAGVVSVLAVRDAPVLHRHFRVLAYASLVGGGLLITAAQASLGPVSVAPTLLYAAVPIFAVYHLPRWTAAVVIGLVSIEFGALVAIQDGYAEPGFFWTFLTGSLVVLGVVFGGLLGSAVDEVASLGQLRRFLPEAVADAVLSAPELLQPHRRQISVIFCDLRGFTQFAAAVEPEDVVEVLDEYYRTVGKVLSESEATVGTFAGDGIMAYFNDPLPVGDSAGRAASVALALARPMNDLADRWRRKGFSLSYGVGIAHGFATLGVFGFDGRSDYTALGPVVNLAARLCQAADGTEVLIDRRMLESLNGRAEVSERQITVKGYEDPITAYQLHRLAHTGEHDSATPSFQP